MLTVAVARVSHTLPSAQTESNAFLILRESEDLSPDLMIDIFVSPSSKKLATRSLPVAGTAQTVKKFGTFSLTCDSSMSTTGSQWLPKQFVVEEDCGNLPYPIYHRGL
jgi:hypothetical protein